MFKKFTSLLLALLFPVLMLAGCGDSDTPDTPDDSASAGSPVGWWVRPEGYESEGLSLVDIFKVEEDEMWTSYSSFGEIGSHMSYSFEDGVLSLDFGMDSSADFALENDQLKDPDTGSVEFVRVDEPKFKGQDLSYDGRWYLGGKKDGSYFEITGKNYKKVRVAGGQSMTESEGVLKMGTTQISYGDYNIPEAIYLELEGDFAPRLFPSEDGKLLFEEDGTDYLMYVNENSASKEMEPSYDMVNEMMDMDLSTGVMEDGTSNHLSFTPHCFRLIKYLAASDGSLTEQGREFGKWEISGNKIIFHYESGAEDTVDIPTREQADAMEAFLHLDGVPGDYKLEPIF